MLDDSFLYQKDFDNYHRKFQERGFDDLYKSLYDNGRLVETDDSDSQDFGTFLQKYYQYLKLVDDLVKDNYRLQQRVHELGIKNRVRKKLRRFRPLEEVKRYVTQSDLEDILDDTFISKNFLPLFPFSKKAMGIFHGLVDESFEDGLRNIQKQVPAPKIKSDPLVSIIIPTRDGLHHLERLFTNFDKSTGYSNYEFIVVDNASKDGTREYLEGLKNSLRLQVIYNSTNKSYSESNNMAARVAKGKYLLFLNNDVSPMDNWLGQMVSTALKADDIGVVGAKLVYPYKPGFANSYRIQHGGLGFKLEDDFIRPVNLGGGDGFFTRNTKKEEEKAGVTAACLLVEKKKFDQVGGFDESYWYGYEDVDLCLKLRAEGFRNVINNAAVLFHHEFGTQGQNKEKEVTGYRKRNMEIFRNKWQKTIYPKLWESLLKRDGIYTTKQLHVGFVVTEAKSDTATGDYYTAKEFGEALFAKGCKVSYIGVRSSLDPYSIDPDVDVLISMIDGYDISKIEGNKLVKVAWCRNWFERWVDHEYFRDFDIVLTNSEKSQRYFKDQHLVDSYLFKIATNKERFTKQFSQEELKAYASDICFTGNYWQVPRDIASLFETDKFKDHYKIKIFGKDWGQVKSLKPFWQGFLDYKNLAKVYASGKILIDDATFVVNEWGSVNSRVFDGAASGILVLTNGIEGSQKTFDNLIPTFNSKEELTALLEKYLSDDQLRQKKTNEIRDYVLTHHTYEHRADQLFDILKKELAQKRINLKLPIPRWSEVKQWGDLYFGQGLKRELEKNGFTVKLQILPQWHKANFGFANIVLRGLSIFNLPAQQLNVMWNISHPEKVPLDEYRSYDYTFVASAQHVANLKKKGLDNIHVLNQCFDETIFNPKKNGTHEKYDSDILFVGNTRKHFRKIVRDTISWPNIDKYNFRVFGGGWNEFIDKKYISGEFIANSDLKNYYQNAKILLNDHWDDMNEYGFVSNRLFDASACGAFIISDANPGIKAIFGTDIIEEYTNPAQLHKLLDKYLTNPEERQARAEKAKKLVENNHSFAKRTQELLSTVSEFNDLI